MSLESEFEALRDEWEPIVVADQHDRLKQVRDWETRLDQLRDEQNALLRNGAWNDGRSDMLGILGESRREAFHSAFLAWLLDPRGRHGFGVAFLVAFFRRCSPDMMHKDLHQARTALEVTRGDTRADIVITGPRFSIVIENKVDAIEQPQQCDRLYFQFGREAGTIFVFLSPSGRLPATATGPARDAFISLRHSDIATILRDVLRETPAHERAKRGREVACNYLETLEREFP